MDAKKAYGMLAAVATRLGDRARTDEGLLAQIRATKDVDAFRAVIRERAAGLVPPAVLDAFVNEVVHDDDWVLWRSRLLIQARMTKEGKKPAAGHEQGRGVGRP